MSAEVKQAEKARMDPKYIATLTARLFAACVVVAFLLGLVNMVTLPNITARKKAATDAALKQVVENPDGSAFSDALELSGDMTAAASGAGATLSALYAVTEGGANAGYALTVVASGSQGSIEMMVGVDEADVVTGVSIVNNSETPGIGSKVMGNEPTANGTPVLDQFVGKSPADGTLSVGGNIDAISGATVSSRGVTAGVNAALAVAALLD
ncbi:MAG: RnfABCDGE type electron transport complex subunit G [Oscillibacter sp.]|nr:RnfABCDGE type electron transport complex subunit G [Oscillibacter sp.]